MALPKLGVPTYELILPSTGKTVKYRPFLVKEEKLLLLAMESGEEKEIISAVKTLLKNCITSRLKVDNLPSFDLEYIFLKIRAASVGEVIELTVTCTDDNETTTPAAISANISSAQFDIDDGNNFAFIRRVVPDITFDGSTASNPSATLSLIPYNSSGSGISDPTSEGGSNSGTITRSATAPVEKYTDRLDIRIRARQMALKIESSGSGVTWQLGSPRIDIRADGRR